MTLSRRLRYFFTDTGNVICFGIMAIIGYILTTEQPVAIIMRGLAGLAFDAIVAAI